MFRLITARRNEIHSHLSDSRPLARRALARIKEDARACLAAANLTSRGYRPRHDWSAAMVNSNYNCWWFEHIWRNCQEAGFRALLKLRCCESS